MLTINSTSELRARYQDLNSFGSERLFYNLLYKGETKTVDEVDKSKGLQVKY